jgi:hypothetical protein
MDKVRVSFIPLFLIPWDLLPRIHILNPSAECPSAYVISISKQRPKCGEDATHRKPSCRRNSARFVPLLQNRIAYDKVAIVAACPELASLHMKHKLSMNTVWRAKLSAPRMKQPPKYILLRLYFSAFMNLYADSMSH